MAESEAGPSGARVKVAVEASGRILLDGREVSLGELDAALQVAKINGSTVQYTRDHPSGEAPPVVDEVMKLINDNRLRITLGTPAEERPSNVIEFPGIETFFSKVRRQAARHRGISLIRPDQMVFGLPAPQEGAIHPQLVEGVKSVFTSDQPRQIAAIAAADALAGDPAKPPTVTEVARRVPFFGLLVGFAYVGHAVWIFEAQPSMMPAGCEEADVLIVDSNAIATLPASWAEDAAAVMRNANILVFDRTRHKVGVLRVAGEVPGRIEFPK